MIQKQFTTREAAKAVGITRATVQAWIAAKKIRAPKPISLAGIVVRIWSKAVKMLLAAREQTLKSRRWSLVPTGGQLALGWDSGGT
jgi:excisionase family DNA binding protein